MGTICLNSWASLARREREERGFSFIYKCAFKKFKRWCCALEIFPLLGEQGGKQDFSKQQVGSCKPGLTTKLSLLPLLSFGCLGRQEQIVCELFPSMWLLLFSTRVFHQSPFQTSCVSLVDAGICGIFPTPLLKGWLCARDSLCLSNL